MTQLEILILAQDAILHKYEVADAMTRIAPCEMAFAYRSEIAQKAMEINRLIQMEHNVPADEAAQPKQEPLYRVVTVFADGHAAHKSYTDKDIAVKAYNLAKDLMGTIPGAIVRVSILNNDKVIRSCDKEV